MSTHTIYTETLLSKSTNALGWLITLLLLLAVVYQIFVGPIGNNPASTGSLVMMVALFSVVFANFSRLKVTLTPENITVGYGLITRHIRWENIESCHLDQTSTLKYGGFGIRIAKINGVWRTVYNIVASPRVVVKLKSGTFRELVFSTENPEQVMQLVNSYIHAE